MKISKSPQKVLILFLTALIIISFFMIVRLEGKAASLQSQWDEHQLSLKANEDILNKLDYFSREVKNGLIKLDGSNASLESAKSHVTVFDKRIDLVSDGDVQLVSKNAYSISYGPKQVVFYSKKDGDISIAASDNKRIGYDKKADYIYMTHTGSRITIGKHGNNQRTGIELISKTGGPKLYIYDDEIIIDGQDKKKEYKILIAPQKDFIKIKKGKSVISLEKESINFEAIGDINITSKNGNVNINGKKVNLNE